MAARYVWVVEDHNVYVTPPEQIVGVHTSRDRAVDHAKELAAGEHLPLSDPGRNRLVWSDGKDNRILVRRFRLNARYE